MWLGDLLAVEQPPAGVSDQLIIMIGGVVTAAFAALGAVLVAIVNSRASKTTASPPAPTNADEHVLYERTAVLARRADDSDDRFHVLDLARAKDRDDLDDVLDYLDEHDPGWRR